MNIFSTRKFASLAALAAIAFCPAVLATDPERPSEIILPGDDRLAIADFDAYEAEYASAFGRFINQVRPFQTDEGQKISVINLIHMPQAVIVDHRTIDRTSLRMESFVSPYFAWGQEHITGRMDANGYDWVRVPLDGSAVIRTQGGWDTNGVFDGLGFSPTFSAFLSLEIGDRFRIPRDQARVDGTLDAVLVEMEVIGRESLRLDSGVHCECLVLEETDAAGSIQRYWVGEDAPFLFRRHRDVGGPRDFVSDVLSFRPL
jgi:hypothetical protein